MLLRTGSGWLYCNRVRCTLFSVRAQETRSTVLGRISDPTGAVIPGAVVEAKNLDTGVRAMVPTNAQRRLPAALPDSGAVLVDGGGSGIQEVGAFPVSNARRRPDHDRCDDGDRAGIGERPGHRGGAAAGHIHRLHGTGDRQPQGARAAADRRQCDGDGQPVAGSVVPADISQRTCGRSTPDRDRRSQGTARESETRNFK